MKKFFVLVLFITTLPVSKLIAQSYDTIPEPMPSNHVLRLEGGLSYFANPEVGGFGVQAALTLQKDSDEKGGFMPGARLTAGMFEDFVLWGGSDIGKINVVSLEFMAPARFYSAKTGLWAEIYGSGVVSYVGYTQEINDYAYSRFYKERHNLFYLGVKAGVGVGYSPKNSNTGFVLYPFNLSAGLGEYARLEATLGLEIYLD
jgi:hypothetical protein